MPQANDSVLVTPGAGATIATHLQAAKEHEVVMLAEDDGHLLGTKETYVWNLPPVVAGANKVFCDIFNATGSGRTLILRALYLVPQLDTAVTGVLSRRLHLTRTTAVGTGGTAATANGTSLTANTITSLHAVGATVPAQVTARAAPTGGATAGAWILETNDYPEEGPPSGAVGVTMDKLNLLDALALFNGACRGIVVSENSGLRIVQGAVASVGNVGFRFIFTLH